MTALELRYRNALIEILRTAHEMSELMDGPDVEARRHIIDTCNRILSMKYLRVDPMRAPRHTSTKPVAIPRYCPACSMLLPPKHSGEFCNRCADIR